MISSILKKRKKFLLINITNYYVPDITKNMDGEKTQEILLNYVKKFIIKVKIN